MLPLSLLLSVSSRSYKYIIIARSPKSERARQSVEILKFVDERAKEMGGTQGWAAHTNQEKNKINRVQVDEYVTFVDRAC